MANLRIARSPRNSGRYTDRSGPATVILRPFGCELTLTALRGLIRASSSGVFRDNKTFPAAVNIFASSVCGFWTILAGAALGRGVEVVGVTCASGRLSHPPSNTPAINTNAADRRNEHLALEGLLRDCAIEFEFTFEFHDLRALVNPVVDGDYFGTVDPGDAICGELCFRFTQLFRSGLATTLSADLSMVLPFPSCPSVSYRPVGDDCYISLEAKSNEDRDGTALCCLLSDHFTANLRHYHWVGSCVCSARHLEKAVSNRHTRSKISSRISAVGVPR